MPLANLVIIAVYIRLLGSKSFKVEGLLKACRELRILLDNLGTKPEDTPDWLK